VLQGVTVKVLTELFSVEREGGGGREVERGVRGGGGEEREDKTKREGVTPKLLFEEKVPPLPPPPLSLANTWVAVTVLEGVKVAPSTLGNVVLLGDPLLLLKSPVAETSSVGHGVIEGVEVSVERRKREGVRVADGEEDFTEDGVW